MKILHVNSLLQLGGAETVLRQLLRNFPEASVAVAGGKTFPDGVHSLYPRPLARLQHSRFHAIVERIAPRDRWTDRAFRQLAEGPHDLVHLHNFHGRYATIDSLAAVARRKPVVWTFHALWGITGGCDHPRECLRFHETCGECPHLNRWPLGPVDDTAEQLAAKRALLAPLTLDVVSPSRWMAEIIRESPIGKGWRVHCIPNAVDAKVVDALRELPPRSPDQKRVTILLVNRNFEDEQKGFPIALAALREFTAGSKPGSRLKLLLAGGKSDWAASQLAGWECEAIPYVSDARALAEVYARAEIFLFASPAENFPCVVLEAMAAGLCVVATPTGGVVEQIENGVSGLIASEISGESLATALRRAASNPAESALLGKSARKRVQSEFSEAIFAKRHRELYEEVLRQWKSAQ